MKRVRMCCLALVIICIIAAIPKTSLAAGGYLWMVDAPSGVNVRNKEKKIVTSLRKGDIIRVVYEDSFWVGYRLDNGEMGYCYKENLHIAHAEEIEDWENRVKNGIRLTNLDAFAIGTILEDCKVYKTANGKVIGSYKAGDEVYIRQIDKYWYRIIWDNKELGYVRSQFVEFSRPNIPAEGDYKKVKCASYAKIYENADYKSKVVGKVKNGHYVIIVDDSDAKYAYVCFYAEGKYGYIAKKYLN